MPKLRMYRLFKLNFVEEAYLYLNIPRRLRRGIAKFRTSNHNLEIERGRHANLDYFERLCKYCLSLNIQYVEDEYHVILECKLYSDWRRIYFGNVQINLFSFTQIMSNNDSEMVHKIALFISQAMKLRESWLSAK